MKAEISRILNNDRKKFKLLPTATDDEILLTETELSVKIPSQYKDFLSSISNGLNFGAIRILPVLSKSNLKKTGDSLARNNKSNSSLWFNGDKNTFNNFLIFGVEESYACFCLKKDDPHGCVWYWTIDSDELEELDYDFYSWLRESIRQEFAI